ncbi:unnamed protein product [Ectocarpus sp. 4 AP-2014]
MCISHRTTYTNELAGSKCFGPFVVNGANLMPRSKLMLDPPLHEDHCFWQNVGESIVLKHFRRLIHRISGVASNFSCVQEFNLLLAKFVVLFVSATRIEISCVEMSCFSAEPGELKVVAIDTGAGLVRLNPEDGGVVIATAKPHITVQQDDNLLIYRSTKQIRIAGSGFEEGMEASQGPSSLPIALLVSSVKASLGTADFGWLGVSDGRKVANVLEDPSIQARNTEIYRGSTRELNVYGTGLNNVVQPILVFKPPLDDTTVNVHVSSGPPFVHFPCARSALFTHYDNVAQFISSTEIAITRNFSFDTPSGPQVPSPWRPEPGPLKIVAIDNGAGRVLLNPRTEALWLPRCWPMS